MLDTQDPQKAYAFSSIVAAGRVIDQASVEQSPEIVPREIKTREDADAALKDAVLLKVNRMLAAPDGVTKKGVTELAGLLDWLMPVVAEAKTQGASPATIDALRAAIMQGLE